MSTFATHSHENSGPFLTFDALLDGSFRVVDLERTEGTFRAVVRGPRRPDEPLLSAREQSVVRKLATGQCQKLVAFDFGLAHTTVSSHLRSALDKLGLPRWETVVLLAAALETGNVAVIADGRPEGASEAAPGERFLVVRRDLSRDALGRLTEAERAVALLVVDGRTNAEIGRARNASPRTVANQVSSLFRKLAVHGRCELIRTLLTGSSEREPESSAFARRVPALVDPSVVLG